MSYDKEDECYQAKLGGSSLKLSRLSFIKQNKGEHGP